MIAMCYCDDVKPQCQVRFLSAWELPAESVQGRRQQSGGRGCWHASRRFAGGRASWQTTQYGSNPSALTGLAAHGLEPAPPPTPQLPNLSFLFHPFFISFIPSFPFHYFFIPFAIYSFHSAVTSFRCAASYGSLGILA